MPTLKLIAAPEVEPVDVTAAKKHARIFISGDDAYVTDLITAARDKFEREAHQYFAEQTWQWSDVPSAMALTLPLRPVIEIVEVTDGNGDTVDAGDYSLESAGMGFGCLEFSVTPTGPLTIQFKVGYREPYPAWVTATDYEEDAIVIHGGTLYVALSDHTSATATEPGVGVDWEDVWVESLETQPSGAPALAKLAIKSLVAHWYNVREAYVASQHGDLRAVPASYLSILQNFR
jgi:uncharacterized phiE125 gp8 family phage protein